MPKEIDKPEGFDVVTLDKFEFIENEHGKYVRWAYTKNGEKDDGLMPISCLINAIESFHKNNCDHIGIPLNPTEDVAQES